MARLLVPYSNKFKHHVQEELSCRIYQWSHLQNKGGFLNPSKLRLPGSFFFPTAYPPLSQCEGTTMTTGFGGFGNATSMDIGSHHNHCKDLLENVTRSSDLNLWEFGTLSVENLLLICKSKGKTVVEINILISLNPSEGVSNYWMVAIPLSSAATPAKAKTWHNPAWRVAAKAMRVSATKQPATLHKKTQDQRETTSIFHPCTRLGRVSVA